MSDLVEWVAAIVILALLLSILENVTDAVFSLGHRVGGIETRLRNMENRLQDTHGADDANL